MSTFRFMISISLICDLLAVSAQATTSTFALGRAEIQGLLALGYLERNTAGELVPTALGKAQDVVVSEKGVAIPLQVRSEMENIHQTVAQTSELLKKECPPGKCVVIAMGRSPSFFSAHLQATSPEGYATNVPLSGLTSKAHFTPEEMEAYRRHLDHYLKSVDFGGKRVVVLDYVQSGGSLVKGTQLIEDYVKSKTKDATFKAEAMGIEGHSMPMELNPAVKRRIILPDASWIRQALITKDGRSASSFAEYEPGSQSNRSPKYQALVEWLRALPAAGPPPADLVVQVASGERLPTASDGTGLHPVVGRTVVRQQELEKIATALKDVHGKVSALTTFSSDGLPVNELVAKAKSLDLRLTEILLKTNPHQKSLPPGLASQLRDASNQAFMLHSTLESLQRSDLRLSPEDHRLVSGALDEAIAKLGSSEATGERNPLVPPPAIDRPNIAPAEARVKTWRAWFNRLQRKP